MDSNNNVKCILCENNYILNNDFCIIQDNANCAIKITTLCNKCYQYAFIDSNTQASVTNYMCMQCSSGASHFDECLPCP